MKALKWIWAVAVMVVAGVQAEEIVVSWEANGVLVAEGMEPGSTGIVEAASNLGETFTTVAGFFADDNGMMNVSASITAPAMFFRVKGTPASSIPDGMVQIPGGTNSGTDPDDGAYSLTVSTFYMDRTEVTKAQWDTVFSWAIANGYSFDNAGSGKAANHPVHTVNWHDCVKWCNARSQMEGRTPCYTVSGGVYKTGQSSPDCNFSANGYRLPTNTEWEYAARGGYSGRRFPWGDTITHSQANYYSFSTDSYDTSTTHGYHPAYDDSGTPYTSPAGSFAANGYGLYDMSGNVWEWCWDPSGSYRNFRGGCWFNYFALSLRCGRAYWSLPDFAYYSCGFRAVCR